MAKLTDEQLAGVDSIFAGYDIPRYIWLPIGMMESGLNPGSQANTSKEDSRGLFQINIKANTQFSDTNLYDPYTNASIAAKFFMSTAYSDAVAKGITDPGLQAQYVWKYGIRPDWTNVTSRGWDTQIAELARSTAKTNTAAQPTTPTAPAGTGGNTGAGTGTSGELLPGEPAKPPSKPGLGDIPGMIAKIFNPDTWGRVLWVIIGLLLLIMGLYVAFGSVATGAVSQVVGAVAASGGGKE